MKLRLAKKLIRKPRSLPMPQLRRVMARLQYGTKMAARRIDTGSATTKRAARAWRRHERTTAGGRWPRRRHSKVLAETALEGAPVQIEGGRVRIVKVREAEVFAGFISRPAAWDVEVDYGSGWEWIGSGPRAGEQKLHQVAVGFHWDDRVIVPDKRFRGAWVPDA